MRNGCAARLSDEPSQSSDGEIRWRKLHWTRPGPRPRTLAAWTGRVLLLGAVAFWWGGIVVPRLLGLASSSLVPLPDLPRHLDPEVDGSLANAVSAVALAILAIMAVTCAIVSKRRASGRIAVGGWLVVGLTAALLAWDELSDFHVTGLTDLERSVFGAELVDTFGRFIWVLLLSPLIAAFTLVMGVFIAKGLPGQYVRVWFVLGLAAWMLVLVLEISTPILLVRVAQAEFLGSVLEETLEFSGTLLMTLGAAMALRRPAARVGRGLFNGTGGRVALGWGIVVFAFGSVLALWVIRVPIVESRGPTTHIDAFAVRLRDQDAAVQEVRMPAAPVARVRLRLGRRDPSAREGTLGVRFTRLGTSAPELSGGVGRVPLDAGARWLDIDLVPPLTEPEGMPLAMWVVAHTNPGAALLIGATKTNPYPQGGLWVNGEPTWPDQDLEFVLYSAAEPTLSKLRAFWDAATLGWRWPLVVGELTVALVVAVMTPALLAAGAFASREPASLP